MKVRVKLFATLVQYFPGARSGIPFELDLPDGSTLAGLISYLALPEEEVKINFVNGRTQDPGTLLVDGDEVGIFPPIGGGLA